MVKQDLKKYGVDWKVRMDMDLILELFEKRSKGEKITIPKAFERNFEGASGGKEKAIEAMIKLHRQTLLKTWNDELKKQTSRNASAVKALATKHTKKNENERDVSSRKIQKLAKDIERLEEDNIRENDSRIYSQYYSPVIVLENGERVLKPMRYLLRPSFADESWDRKFSGCYNARRDALTKSWNSQFGSKHGVIIVTSFFENVTLHDFEGRKLKRGEDEQKVVIEFNPRGQDYMVVPVIWDQWKKGKDVLNSFALITDDPPKEVSDAGHDRCPIFLNEDRINDWLNPKGKSRDELFEILNDRETPYYEHALAG